MRYASFSTLIFKIIRKYIAFVLKDVFLSEKNTLVTLCVLSASGEVVSLVEQVIPIQDAEASDVSVDSESSSGIETRGGLAKTAKEGRGGPIYGKNFLNENHSVIVRGTNIHPKSRITAGAIIMRAADREALVAMDKSPLLTRQNASVMREV